MKLTWIAKIEKNSYMTNDFKSVEWTKTCLFYSLQRISKDQSKKGYLSRRTNKFITLRYWLSQITWRQLLGKEDLEKYTWVYWVIKPKLLSSCCLQYHSKATMNSELRFSFSWVQIYLNWINYFRINYICKCRLKY